MRRSGTPSSRHLLRILFGDEIAMGPGKSELLRLIESTGSMSAAAREMNMSYRRAWTLVDTMNRCFKGPIVATAAGGRRGGGARLTVLGRDVLRRYRAMELRAAESVRKDLVRFRRLLRPSSS